MTYPTELDKTQVELQLAKILIRQKRYDEARDVLKKIPDVEALALLSIVDRLDPPSPTRQNTTKTRIETRSAETRSHTPKFQSSTKRLEITTKVDRPIPAYPPSVNKFHLPLKLPTVVSQFLAIVLLTILLLLILMLLLNLGTGGLSGTVCSDGWISGSTGSGTCSHHGGISSGRQYKK